jgi:hypothetical protein
MTRLLIVIAALLVSYTAHASEIGCGISVIPDSQIKRGCGCGYHLPVDGRLHTIFQAGLNSSEQPRMFIDGELVELLPAAANQQSGYSKVGDEFTESFSFEQIAIRFDNKVSSSCAGTEGCEVTSFDSTMRVSGKSCSIEPLKLKGDCGC